MDFSSASEADRGTVVSSEPMPSIKQVIPCLDTPNNDLTPAGKRVLFDNVQLSDLQRKRALDAACGLLSPKLPIMEIDPAILTKLPVCCCYNFATAHDSTLDAPSSPESLDDFLLPTRLLLEHNNRLLQRNINDLAASQALLSKRLYGHIRRDFKEFRDDGERDEFNNVHETTSNAYWKSTYALESAQLALEQSRNTYLSFGGELETQAHTEIQAEIPTYMNEETQSLETTCESQSEELSSDAFTETSEFRLPPPFLEFQHYTPPGSESPVNKMRAEGNSVPGDILTPESVDHEWSGRSSRESMATTARAQVSLDEIEDAFRTIRQKEDKLSSERKTKRQPKYRIEKVWKEGERKSARVRARIEQSGENGAI